MCAVRCSQGGGGGVMERSGCEPDDPVAFDRLVRSEAWEDAWEVLADGVRLDPRTVAVCKLLRDAEFDTSSPSS